MKRFVVIDTETGGLDPARYSLLTIGAVVWERNLIVDEIEIPVAEPDIVTEKEALAVNGCDVEWLRRNGQIPNAAVDSLEGFLHRNFDTNVEKVSLAGHNVQFDIAFIKRLYNLANRLPALFSHRVLDTASVLHFLSLAGQIPFETASSNSAFEYFGISFKAGTRHSALADARATAALLDKLLDMAEARNTKHRGAAE